MKKYINLYIQEVPRTLRKINTEIHIKIYYNQTADSQNQRDYFENCRKQLVTDKGSSIRLTTTFSTETVKARMHWDNIFNVMK